MNDPSYEFGHFTFDARRRLLTCDGVTVPLTHKASELLSVLLAHAGRPVSKESIYEAVWGDKIVEDGNLTQTIYVLRRTLTNGSPGSTMIRTIPHVGYAFVEPVRLRPSPKPPFQVRAAAFAACAICVLALSLYGPYASRHPVNVASNSLLSTSALKAYQLGRQAWNKPTYTAAVRALPYFQRVVKLAPDSALGYAGLSDAYLLIAGQTKAEKQKHTYFQDAKAYAARALAADANSSEAHASQAQALYYGMEPGAPAEFERAIALNPRNALAHRWYGEYWVMEGRFARGASELAQSNAIEPLVSQDLFWLGIAHYYARNYDAAGEAFRETLAAGERDPEVGLYLALTYEATGNTRAALGELQHMARVHHDLPDLHAVRASILARHGQRTAALREIEPLLHSPQASEISSVSVAVTLARAGMISEAQDWLRAHHTHPDETSIFPQYDPRLVGLHLNPLPPASD